MEDESGLQGLVSLLDMLRLMYIHAARTIPFEFFGSFRAQNGIGDSVAIEIDDAVMRTTMVLDSDHLAERISVSLEDVLDNFSTEDVGSADIISIGSLIFR
jgi:hypothetical protein